MSTFASAASSCHHHVVVVRRLIVGIVVLLLAFIFGTSSSAQPTLTDGFCDALGCDPPGGEKCAKVGPYTCFFALDHHDYD